MYSQNAEEKHILEYFGDFTGTLLDIGANDGVTFSNSRRLIELGWKAVLVEPSEAGWEKLMELYGNHDKVTLVPAAIGLKNTTAVLYESGAHVAGKPDRALVSSLKHAETVKWTGVSFEEVNVEVINYATLLKRCKVKTFNFITIDAEGMDLEILSQIDLSQTQLMCIEWNLSHPVKNTILEYCATFGMGKLIYQSPENLLIAR